jgi:hypothetical protein
MKFKKEDLLNDVFEEVYEKVTDTSRWSTNYEKVFKYEDKFYITWFSRGATEYQDESPYEDEGDEIECPEVIPTEETIIVYKVKK